MRALVSLVVLLASLLWCALALGSPSGRISLGPRGPIELTAQGAQYSGELFVENTGDTPLTVSRISIRTDSDDPRVPPKVSVKPDKPAPFALQPHERSRVVVSWAPDASTRQRQAFGHVVVTSTDEASGEVAMGFVARQPAPLSHPLSLVIFVPLFGGIALLVLNASGRGPRSVRPFTVAVSSVPALVGLWVWHSFDPSITRADGNDGLQMVEHASWVARLGAEWFVGVDGTNVTALAAVGVVGLAAAVWSRPPPRDAAAFDGLLLALVASGCGGLVAQDGILLLAFVALAMMTTVVALAFFGEDARAAKVAAAFFALGFAALALALAALHDESGKAFLVGGDTASSTWSLPELARVSFLSKTTKLLGQPLVAGAWSLGFVASLAVAGAFPLHAWLPRALSAAPPALGALIVAALTSVGSHLLLRFDAMLPEAARWAGTTTLLFGLVGVVYAGLVAMAQRDLARTLGAAMVAQASLFVVALGSLTHQGIAGAVLGIPSRAVGGALLALACGALHARIKTRDVLVVRGLAGDAPWLLAAIAAGALGAMAAPGTAPGWLVILATFATLPRGVGAALAVVVAAALLGIALGRAVVRMASGSLPEVLRSSALLEPFGGSVPDLDVRGTITALALALLVLVLGVHPAPVLSASQVSVHELGAALNPPGPGEIAAR